MERRRAAGRAEGDLALVVSGVKLVVGIGSNLGSRVALVAAAMDDLAQALDARNVLRSRLYRSEALTDGSPPGPDFVNAAVALQIDRSAEEVLAVIRALETRYHRARDVRWGDRTLDLDALWADEPFGCPGLRVPHPRLRERSFALAPLHDVAPEAAWQEFGTLGPLTLIDAPVVTRSRDEVIVTGALDLADALAFGLSRGVSRASRELVAPTPEAFVEAHGCASGRTVVLSATPLWRGLVDAESGPMEGSKWRIHTHDAGTLILRREP